VGRIPAVARTQVGGRLHLENTTERGLAGLAFEGCSQERLSLQARRPNFASRRSAAPLAATLRHEQLPGPSSPAARRSVTSLAATLRRGDPRDAGLDGSGRSAVPLAATLRLPDRLLEPHRPPGRSATSPAATLQLEGGLDGGLLTTSAQRGILTRTSKIREPSSEGSQAARPRRRGRPQRERRGVAGGVSVDTKKGHSGRNGAAWKADAVQVIVKDFR
jgi:hypothetical protein